MVSLFIYVTTIEYKEDFMKKIIFLIFLLITCPLKTISYCEGLEGWEETFTVWDVLEPGSVEETYDSQDVNTAYSYELDQETIFHLNDPESEGIYDVLYDIYPVVQLEFFYIFYKSQGKGIGYLGSFEYDSLIYKKKQSLGVRVRTKAGYNPYH